MIPEFVDAMNLPPGGHECAWEDLVQKFGNGARRERLCGELQGILNQARLCGFLRAVIGGSFVTAKEVPGDLDILFVVKRGLTKADVSEKCAKLMNGTGSKQEYGHDLMYCNEDPDVVRVLIDGLGFDGKTGKNRGMLVLSLQ